MDEYERDGGEEDIEIDGAVSQCDWTEVDPATAVVDRVTESRGCEPTSLSPLRDGIDTDALNSMLTPTRLSESVENVSVSFPYEGGWVTVHGDGTVLLRGISPKRPDPH